MQLVLSVQRASRAKGLPRTASIQQWARAALTGSGRGRAVITVRLVDEAESGALNKRYRRKAGPTNVLAFPYTMTESAALAGDLVICAPLVAREATIQHKPVRAHWAHLVVHGILHLRGYDHHQEQDARAMEAVEIRTLKQLGFANPYVRT